MVIFADIGTICNTWLGSSSMRCLLGLTVSCFERLSAAEEKEFVDCLLSTYMQNSPHFDWVLARLGSCFPRKVIEKYMNGPPRVSRLHLTRNFIAESYKMV